LRRANFESPWAPDGRSLFTYQGLDAKLARVSQLDITTGKRTLIE